MNSPLLPLIHVDCCDGCGQCITSCPSGALVIAGQKAELAHPARCTYDGACEEVCPNGAIELPYQIVWGATLDLATDND